jgi:hypothetical protein
MAIIKMPLFIDFEASSLSIISYPIEIAWNNQNGDIQSYLINPKNIPDWDDWDDEAERVHGIPRAELLKNGLHPIEVCKTLLPEVDGKIIYTDAPDFDKNWFLKLLKAGRSHDSSFQLKRQPTFLYHQALIYDILFLKYQHLPDTTRQIVIESKTEEIRRLARQRIPNQHRATYDVQNLIEQWKLAG